MRCLKNLLPLPMRFLLLCLLGLFASKAFAQDVIVKTNGERLQVTEIQLADSTISFRYYATPNGNYFLIHFREIAEIQYSDGRIEVFGNRKPDKSPTTSNSDDMYHKAVQDADLFYRNYTTPMVLTSVSAAACSPVCGLIPAFFITKTPPKRFNLGYPNPELMNDRTYADAYVSRSWQIKRNKVWLGYGIGVGVSLAGTFLYYLSR